MSTIGSLHFTAAAFCLNLILIPTVYYSHRETQNHTCCKRNYTLLFFLHFSGTNHIAGSRLSIGRAGAYSKEQDKKKRIVWKFYFSAAPCNQTLELLFILHLVLFYYLSIIIADQICYSMGR